MLTATRTLAYLSLFMTLLALMLVLIPVMPGITLPAWAETTNTHISLLPTIAALISIPAVGMTVPPFTKLRREWFWVFYVNLGVAYLAISQSHYSGWFLGIPALTAGLEPAVRLQFYEQLFKTRHLWIEPLIIAMAVISYAAVVVFQFGSLEWYHYLLPAPFLAMGMMHAVMTGADFSKLKSFAARGYNLSPGEPAPDFELLDENGHWVKLSDFFGERHVLLIFYRGDWCPYCHMMLRSYARRKEEFQKRNVLLLAVGPDDPESNRELIQLLELDFHILSDDNLHTVSKYGIEVKDHAKGMPTEESSPLPASFLIDQTGIIRHTSHPERVGEFINPEQIFKALEAIPEEPSGAESSAAQPENAAGYKMDCVNTGLHLGATGFVSCQQHVRNLTHHRSTHGP